MILDIINKKRLGLELSYDEIDEAFNGYLKGDVESYQMSALLMAICINGMSDQETFDLTDIFIKSGEILDFSFIDGIKVDKHSTGGIGDKTTLVITPIAAACGIPVIKMSGRGLGYTGGTIDKLESIKGFRIDLDDDEIKKQVEEIGAVMTGQTKELVPMDKAIYSLRDVTSTVSSIPLIASSIMSKKIAAGADKIVIDVKVGNGALISNYEDADELSILMEKIGEKYNRKVITIVSNMNIPLGHAVGNSLEVMEAIKVLKGEEEDNNFVKLCNKLASAMVCLGKEIRLEEAKKLVSEVLESGKAYKKFLEIVEYQKGDINSLKVNPKKFTIKATDSGTITNIDALKVGKLSLLAGAGKLQEDEQIDYTAGVYLEKLVGEEVTKGEVIATVYTDRDIYLADCDGIFTIN